MSMPELISWDDDFSVNIKEIDDQHKMLISILHDLQKSSRDATAKEVLMYTFNDLIRYTAYHFEHEEQLMRDYDYPEYEEHAQEHKRLKDRVVEMQEHFQVNYSSEVIYLTMEFLSDWIYKHLYETDKKYSKFFNNKGLF